MKCSMSTETPGADPTPVSKPGGESFDGARLRNLVKGEGRSNREEVHRPQSYSFCCWGTCRVEVKVDVVAAAAVWSAAACPALWGLYLGLRRPRG